MSPPCGRVGVPNDRVLLLQLFHCALSTLLCMNLAIVLWSYRSKHGHRERSYMLKFTANAVLIRVRDGLSSAREPCAALLALGRFTCPLLSRFLLSPARVAVPSSPFNMVSSLCHYVSARMSVLLFRELAPSPLEHQAWPLSCPRGSLGPYVLDLFPLTLSSCVFCRCFCASSLCMRVPSAFCLVLPMCRPPSFLFLAVSSRFLSLVSSVVSVWLPSPSCRTTGGRRSCQREGVSPGRRAAVGHHPGPCPAGCQLQDHEEGGQRGYQGTQPRAGVLHCPCSRHRTTGDPSPPSSAVRGQECAVRVCGLQDCPWPRVRRHAVSDCVLGAGQRRQPADRVGAEAARPD